MKISVVTACRNSAATIRDSLESVARQRRDGFEVEHVVVDGCSTDGTVGLLRQLAGFDRNHATVTDIKSCSNS